MASGSADRQEEAGNERSAANGTVNGDGEAASKPPPAKRRRVALACNACRIRKSRCNGGQPRCSLCEQFDFECAYEAADASTNVIVRKDYMSRFEQRIDSLEEKVRRHDDLLRNPQLATPSRDDGGQSRQNIVESSKHVRFRNEIAVDAAKLQELPSEEVQTDGMAVTFVNEEDTAFFGLSSNIAFIRHIARSMMPPRSSADVNSPGLSDDFGFIENGIISASRLASPLPTESAVARNAGMKRSIYHLPSEVETRTLMRSYFSNTGLLYPYIHEPTFLETYEHMKADNFTQVRRTWLGLLNMILALATSTSACSDKSTVDKRLESDVFYQRAYELCKRQMLRGTSLETVQYLLLMSQYLQGTVKSVQTWAIHGLAVKSALSLGLHSTDAAMRFSPIEREMRKRTWYGCVMLDRSLSVTFGRPHAIPEDHVRLPLPTLLEDEHGIVGPLGNYTFMSVPFFSASITLYKVQWRVIYSLYGQNLGCDQPLGEMETITQVFKLEQELSDWEHSLVQPLCLRTPSLLLLDQDSALDERFRVILTLRYLNLQILLHRPFLSRCLDLRGKTSSENQTVRSVDQLAANFIDTCVRSSEDIISIVHSIVSAKPSVELLGAWWFSLYYTFSAALVIFASSLIPPGQIAVNTISASQIERGHSFLALATEAIRYLDGQNQVARRCADQLEKLSQLLLRQLSSPEAVDRADKGMFLPQEMFQNGSLGQISDGIDFDVTGLTNPVDMNNYMTSDLELGQFFVPDEFERWVHGGASRQVPAG